MFLEVLFLELDKSQVWSVASAILIKKIKTLLYVCEINSVLFPAKTKSAPLCLAKRVMKQ